MPPFSQSHKLQAEMKLLGSLSCLLAAPVDQVGCSQAKNAPYGSIWGFIQQMVAQVGSSIYN